MEFEPVSLAPKASANSFATPPYHVVSKKLANTVFPTRLKLLELFCGVPCSLCPQTGLCPLLLVASRVPFFFVPRAGQVCSTMAPFSPICFSWCSQAPIRHGRLLPTCARSPIDEKWQKQVLKVEVLAYCSECIKNRSQTPHKEFYTHNTYDARETEKQTWG